MAKKSIFILDGGRRLPRADILHNNKGPGLFTRFTTTQLGGMAVDRILGGCVKNDEHLLHVTVHVLADARSGGQLGP